MANITNTESPDARADALSSRFSWITDSRIPASGAVWDREVVDDATFAVVPSMGSLVPGWLLAVPRRPMLSLRELSQCEGLSLFSLCNKLSSRLAGWDKDVYFFEHGSSSAGSKTGCGVDQAHLHIVPLPFDLIDAATCSAYSNMKWSNMSGDNPLTRLPKHGEYIAIWRASDGMGAFATVSRPVSQWCRRLIAAKLGVDAEWNYRMHPQQANVERTLKRMLAPDAENRL